MSDKSNTFGKEIGLLHEVIVTGRKVGADHVFWSRLAHSQPLFRRIVQFVNSNKGTGYPIEVDYDNALPQELIKAGNYDEVQYLLSGSYNFPIIRTGKRSIVIELWEEGELGGDADEKEALLDQLGYRHANIIELLTLAISHPKVVDEYDSIKALGSLSNTNLGSKACAWIGRGSGVGDKKRGRFLGVSFSEKLFLGTYAVVQKIPEDSDVITEPRSLVFKNMEK